MGSPRPLMENLIRPGMGSKDGQGSKSILGEIPGHSDLSAAASFMGAVKALAFQKLTESPAHNKNQILNALFGNSGNNNQQGGGEGPQSLLGKPPSLMSLGGGMDRNMGDGLLPVPDQGQSQGNNMGYEEEDYGYDGNYGGYGDEGFQVC